MNAPAITQIPTAPSPASTSARPRTTQPVAILGIPFDNVTTAETIALIENMVASRDSHYLATANVDFLVQSLHDVELRRILLDADLVLCDGTPLVWASRWLGNPLPERVAGSDLVPLLIQVAARKHYRIFFLGGTPEATEGAVSNLQRKYPELLIAGHYSPPFGHLLEMNHHAITRRIREAKPDLLFVSFGCPKQEKWISMHYRSLGVPVSVGVGATIDFLAGTAARAPRWMRRSGTEWIFRLLQEPRRLFRRYVSDLWWFGRVIAAQWWQLRFRAPAPDAPVHPLHSRTEENWHRLKMPEHFDVETVARDHRIYESAIGEKSCLLVDLSAVRVIDSTGAGFLVHLQKKLRAANSALLLLAPSASVRRGLDLLRLTDNFTIVPDVSAAQRALEHHQRSLPVLSQPGYFPGRASLSWHNEVTAANAAQVWDTTEKHLESYCHGQKLIVDLASLRFIDSTGLGLMVRARKQAAKKGVSLVFLNVQENVRNVLRIAKMESLLLDDPK